MTVVLDFADTNAAGTCIGLEGIEIALRGAVLIGQIDVESTSLKAQTTGDAMGVAPVHIVGGRGIGHARRIEGHITYTALIVGG